jgi:ligand-binding SRPBCC domain-containing protein
MFTVIKKSFINCSVDELFDFHLDTNNIIKIIPKNIEVELLNTDNHTYEDKIIKLKTTRFFVSVYWEVKIEKLEKPNMLVDVAIKSPFVYWKHQHIFTKKGNVTELKDIIEYKLPFGVIGKLLNIFVDYDIRKMFEFRHLNTKKILEK